MMTMIQTKAIRIRTVCDLDCFRSIVLMSSSAGKINSLELFVSLSFSKASLSSTSFKYLFTKVGCKFCVSVKEGDGGDGGSLIQDEGKQVSENITANF